MKRKRRTADDREDDKLLGIDSSVIGPAGRAVLKAVAVTALGWSQDVPRAPGLYWSAVIIDGVQFTKLRCIKRDERMNRIEHWKSGLWISPGMCMGLEPLEVVIQEERREKKTDRLWWKKAEVPMLPGAKEVDA